MYQKYRAIFDYFDALLVGLTATPKDEVDRNTYGLFDVESGVPTNVYGLEDAVHDAFLVPPRSVSVPLKFQREGIRYDQLSEADKEQWDALEWSETGDIPDRVEAEAMNKWLFNIDTVDKVLEHLMTRGQKVAGGDRLGKTIIFAKNQAHAEFIAERFDANYPHYKGIFARVITVKTAYAQSLIDSFTQADTAPHIAISVDMLDTGIDVPEVVNLVFFKLVRSQTKFWQMVGRGTRLCPNLFGPGQPKTFFYIFDYCQNLEFFSQNPDTTDGAVGVSLNTRLFTSRLALLQALDRKMSLLPGGAGVARGLGVSYTGAAMTEDSLRQELAEHLQAQVAAMPLDNFLVRPKRRLVERFAQTAAWEELRQDDCDTLARDVAGLPSALVDDDEEAKRFDVLMLRLQLALLRVEAGFTRWREQVRTIAGLLEEKSSIPMVRAQMPLLQEIQTDVWWEDVTTPLLDHARKCLRSLAKLIEPIRRQSVYTDFEDQLGQETPMALLGHGAGTDFERFRAKARQFLRQHVDHLTIHKLRWNLPLTPVDLDELERLLVAAGVGTTADIDRAREESCGLGLFIRTLVGMDREAAKQAFGLFLSGQAQSANQIEFINLIIDHLTEHGEMDPGRLYESPFTDIDPQGPEGVFTSAQVDDLVALLHTMRQRAVA